MKWSSEEVELEVGSILKEVNVILGNQRISFDTGKADWYPGNISIAFIKIVRTSFLFSDWITDGTVDRVASSRIVDKLREEKAELEHDNELLRAKLEVLMQMLTEITAEHALRGTTRKSA